MGAQLGIHMLRFSFEVAFVFRPELFFSKPLSFFVLLFFAPTYIEISKFRIHMPRLFEVTFAFWFLSRIPNFRICITICLDYS